VKEQTIDAVEEFPEEVHEIVDFVSDKVVELLHKGWPGSIPNRRFTIRKRVTGMAGPRRVPT